MKRKNIKELNNDPTFNYWGTDTHTQTDRDSYFADTWGIALPPPELGLGLSLQPLQQSYTKYDNWVTHSWLKTIWEKCDKFQIKKIYPLLLKRCSVRIPEFLQFRELESQNNGYLEEHK